MTLGPQRPEPGSPLDAIRLAPRPAGPVIRPILPMPPAQMARGPAPSDPSAAQRLADRGVRQARAGKYADAIRQFRQAIALDPSVASVHFNLGVAHIGAGQPADAVTALRAAIARDPRLTSAFMFLASTLTVLGRTEEAAAAFEAATVLDPELHDAWAGLGQIHKQTARPALAEAAYRRAATAAAGTSLAGLYAALAAMAARNLDKAEAHLRAVIAADPGLAKAHAVLGELLSETGRSEAAAASLRRAIALDPAHTGAWYPFAVNHRFSAADRGLIDEMQACLSRPGLTEADRRALHFALAKAYRDLGDPGLEMRHIDGAHAARVYRVPFDKAAAAASADQTIAATPPGYLRRRPDFGVQDATPILIVGMPRSGTTLVEQILSSHPDVAAGGELGFWEGRARAGLGVFGADAHPEALRRVARDYLAVLRGLSADAPRVTDKNPYNFPFLGVIRQVFPRATIVHCRRHPVDTCLSILGTNFEESFAFTSDRGGLVSFYRHYLRLMAHWRTVLPPEGFIEVEYEALIADPEPLIRRLVAACGLDWHDACLSPHLNARRVATASQWQVRQPIYRTSVERWRRYEPWLGELRALLPETGASEAG